MTENPHLQLLSARQSRKLFGIQPVSNFLASFRREFWQLFEDFLDAHSLTQVIDLFVDRQYEGIVGHLDWPGIQQAEI